jgi:hypothetical protein
MDTINQSVEVSRANSDWDDFGPMHAAEPRIVDARFKVVLSPYELGQRRLDRFEAVGTWIGGIGAAVFLTWSSPVWGAWLDWISSAVWRLISGRL